MLRLNISLLVPESLGLAIANFIKGESFKKHFRALFVSTTHFIK